MDELGVRNFRRIYMVLMFQRDLALTGHSTTEEKREGAVVRGFSDSFMCDLRFSFDLSPSFPPSLIRASPLLPCPIDAAIPTAFWPLSFSFSWLRLINP